MTARCVFIVVPLKPVVGRPSFQDFVVAQLLPNRVKLLAYIAIAFTGQGILKEYVAIGAMLRAVGLLITVRAFRPLVGIKAFLILCIGGLSAVRSDGRFDL